MKRPSFQFYPADWRNNAKLRRCSEAARGSWVDILCILHDSDEYGVVRWPLNDLVRAAGVPLKCVKELIEKGVLKGGENGCDDYVYRPVSGRKQGDPVVLLTANTGLPCWYCSRFIRDEYIRKVRGQDTQFGGGKPPPKPSPKGGLGEGKRHGSTSPSPSTTSFNKNNTHTIPSQGCVSDFEKNPNAAEEVVSALAALGFESVSPTHPALNALLAKGVTLGQFIEAGGIARKKNKDFSYLIGVVENQIADANAIGSAPGMPGKAWDADRQSIDAMAVQLGVDVWREASSANGFKGESFIAYTARVRAAVEASVPASGQAVAA